MLTFKKKTNFEYIEKGKGKGHTIIFLHGLMGGLSNFTETIDHFAKNHHVLVPVLPLYTLPILNTNVTALAKFVKKFAEYKGVTNFTLGGNSLGGHISLIFATKYPEMVHSLMLTGSSGLYEKSFGDQFPRRNDYNYIKAKTEEVFYRPEVATKELVDEVFDTFKDRMKGLKILSIAKSAIRHNMKEEIPSLKMPVCIIWGKQDGVTPPEVAVEFNELLPNSDLFWIDKCGHAPMMEHPKKFNELLEDWLQKFDDIKS